MPVQMAAVAFDGTHTAEKELSDLRTSRSDPWLNDVAVVEHHKGGRYSGTGPEYADPDRVDAGIAIGSGTGLLLGMIGGPLGLVFGATAGAALGGAAGSSAPPAFDPLVAEVKDALPRGTSALILLAEEPTTAKLVSAVGSTGRQVVRQELTNDQLAELRQAARSA